MRHLLPILLFFYGVTLCAQNQLHKADIVLEDELLVAHVENNQLVYDIDLDILLQKINNAFEEDTLHFDSVDLIKGQTIGDKTIDFYYLHFKNKKENTQMVRYVVKENNKFCLKNATKSENLYLQFYFACKGVEGCFPRLYASEDKLNWTCRENLVCTPSTKENYCLRSVALFKN